MRRQNSGSTRNQIRIIGGKWRGRKIPVAELEGLRPTGNPMRETLFNWLAPYIEGARVLDAFAGSGALAFEALSRGANEAVLLDISPVAISQLKQCAHLLDANTEIICGNALDYLRSRNSGTFDLVFLDPPFGLSLMPDCIDALANNDHLPPNALIYIEQPRSVATPSVPDNWSMFREKTRGEVRCFLYQADGK